MLSAEFCVDSSALVAIFNSEPESDRFRLELGRAAWMVGWPTILETRIWLVRNRPLQVSDLLDAVLRTALVETVPFDGALEAHARQAFASFGKGRHPAKLNYGDCMAYAVARHHDVPLLFKGSDFAQTDIEPHPLSAAV